tara:strand:+ start:278 stop:982 length:705 start_codon:yes stop_codon:yes gene_type:complete
MGTEIQNLEDINIFVLSGGFGTRLQSLVNDKPKIMADINGKPFIEYRIMQIRKYFPNNKIYLLTHYLSEYIEKYFCNNDKIECIKENKPLGTGGSIKNAIKWLNLNKEAKILVFNGDTYTDVNLSKLVANAKCNITIVGCFHKKPIRFNTLQIENDKITGFLPKNSPNATQYINCGCYYFQNTQCFDDINLHNFSLEDQFKIFLDNEIIQVFKYNDIFIDIGTPEDYIKCKKLI